jgi:RNA polymerase sigma factor (TIGR02999 family)
MPAADGLRGGNRVTDVTELLERWGQGDREALSALVPLVYDELKRLAEHFLRNERSGHTLQPTALVHEAYLRLSGLREMKLQNRAHFYGASANVMRRVLVDYARRRKAEKRGAGAEDTVVLESLPEAPLDLDILALDHALEALAAFAPEKARVVELRYFGGLSVEETAAFMGIAPVTVKRYWTFARAWLYRMLSAGPPGTP